MEAPPPLGATSAGGLEKIDVFPNGWDPPSGWMDSANGFLNAPLSCFVSVETVSVVDPEKRPGFGGVGVPNRSGLGSWWGVLAASPNTFWPPKTAGGALKGFDEVPNVEEVELSVALKRSVEGCSVFDSDDDAAALKILEVLNVVVGGGALKRLEG